MDGKGAKESVKDAGVSCEQWAVSQTGCLV